MTIVAALTLPLAGDTWRKRPESPPDFRQFPAGEARKQAFFGYLGPIVDATNARWQARRTRLISLKNGELSTRDARWLDALVRFFEVPEDLPRAARIEALLVHVDTIPRSLALAQAAKESAWGTSRFTREGHNYFGQRCYQPGCGMVPKNRAAGAQFEVRRFNSPEESVISYFYNINSHPRYEDLRIWRAHQRRLGAPVRGIEAAEFIPDYSERRHAYIDEIQALIRYNRLEDLP